MKIKILDNIFEIENEKSKINEALTEINQFISSLNLQLEGMKINGVEMHKDYYDYIIGNLDSIEIIEVNVKTLKETMDDLLKSTQDYLERAIPELELLVDDIYKDFNKEVWEKFIEFFDGLDSIINILDAISKDNQLYDNVDKYILIKEALSVGIKNLSTALEICDRVWISDIMIYEIKSIFKELYEEINASL